MHDGVRSYILIKCIEYCVPNLYKPENSKNCLSFVSKVKKSLGDNFRLQFRMNNLSCKIQLAPRAGCDCEIITLLGSWLGRSSSRSNTLIILCTIYLQDISFKLLNYFCRHIVICSMVFLLPRGLIYALVKVEKVSYQEYGHIYIYYFSL